MLLSTTLIQSIIMAFVLFTAHHPFAIHMTLICLPKIICCTCVIFWIEKLIFLTDATQQGRTSVSHCMIFLKQIINAQEEFQSQSTFHCDSHVVNKNI